MRDSPDTLRCPTCGAKQSPGPECRRCRCDLSLVTATLQQRDRLHRECLADLADCRPRDALALAARRWSISPDADAARLLAVCNLLLGCYQAALDVYDECHASHRSNLA